MAAGGQGGAAQRSRLGEPGSGPGTHTGLCERGDRIQESGGAESKAAGAAAQPGAGRVQAEQLAGSDSSISGGTGRRSQGPAGSDIAGAELLRHWKIRRSRNSSSN